MPQSGQIEMFEIGEVETTVSDIFFFLPRELYFSFGFISNVFNYEISQYILELYSNRPQTDPWEKKFASPRKSLNTWFDKILFPRLPYVQIYGRK